MGSAVYIEPDLSDERLKRTRDDTMIIGGAERRSASGETIEREAPGQMGFVVTIGAEIITGEIDHQ